MLPLWNNVKYAIIQRGIIPLDRMYKLQNYNYRKIGLRSSLKFNI